MSNITLVLESVGRGESKATEELFPLVYEELRRLAAARMAKEAAGHTLQPTALVHEASYKGIYPIVHRHAARRGSQSAYEARRRRSTARRSNQVSDAAPTDRQRHP